MSSTIYSIIAGTGSYIPPKQVKNADFLQHTFLNAEGESFEKSNQELVDSFLNITTIAERRHVSDDLVTSDIAYFSALEAIKNANCDKEELDYIIVAHNFGDVTINNRRSDFVPSLAARVKYKLGIKNPATVAYDLPFGCPGWLQAVIQADYYIKSGDAKRILVIGAEVLSRVSDPHDRDSMIYADGAGAVVLEAKSSVSPIGILAHLSRSDTFEYAKMLEMGISNAPGCDEASPLYLKMNGRKLYQYALQTVPQAIKSCVEKSGVSFESIKKLLIHQANGKMDDEIVKRLFLLYDLHDIPEGFMPMTVSWLGNSSVATLPTLYDLIRRGAFDKQTIQEGEHVIFASVGAGMNVNAMIYKQN